MLSHLHKYKDRIIYNDTYDDTCHYCDEKAPDHLIIQWKLLNDGK